MNNPTGDGSIPDPWLTVLHQAEQHPPQAISQARQLLRLYPQHGLSHYTLGSALLLAERLDEAQQVLSHAQHIFKRQGHAIYSLHCQRGLLLVQSLMQTTKTEPWEALLEDYLAVGLAHEAARTAIYLARAWHSQRNAEQVTAIVKQWLPLLDARTYPADVARFWRVQASAMISQGLFEQAEQLLDQASALFTEQQLPLETARCQLEAGWLAITTQHLAKAHDLLERAYATFTHFNLPLQQAFCLNNQTALAGMEGDFATALHLGQQARKLFVQLQRQIDTGSCDLNLGIMYHHIGHWQAAQAHYRRAEAVFRQAGAGGRVAICYYNLALTAIAQTDSIQAPTLLDEAEAFVREHDYLLLLPWIGLARVEWLIKLEAIEQAQQLLPTVIQQFDQKGNLAGAGQSWLTFGWLAIRQQLFTQAAQYLETAHEYIKLRPMHAWRVAYGLARCASAQEDWHTAQHYYLQASHWIAQMRRQVASEHLSSMLYEQAAEMYDEALTLALTYFQQDVLHFIENQRTLTLQRLVWAPPPPLNDDDQTAKHLLDQLQRFINVEVDANDLTSSTQFSALLEAYSEHLWKRRTFAPPSLAPDIQLNLQGLRQQCSARHGTDWTMVSYTIHHAQLILCTLTHDDLRVETLPWTSATKSLASRVIDPERHRMIFNDIPFKRGDTERQWAILEDLTQALLPLWIQQRLQPTHRLYLVVSELLQALPWAALRLRGQWLCQQAILQCLPSLTLIDSQPRQALQQRALLIGCSDFGERADPLPYVPIELEELEKVWDNQSNSILECSLDAMTSADSGYPVEQYSVIHLATHAQMITSHAQRIKRQGIAGRILLSNGDLVQDSIMRLRVQGANVVLSTCDGAVIDDLPGGESFSLAWAWLVAGANAVIASLWATDDGSTLPLLLALHTQLVNDVDAALALAEAQRACIAADQQAAEPAPLGWASFITITRSLGKPGEANDLSPLPTPS